MSAKESAIARRYPLEEMEEWRTLLRFFDLSEGFAFIPLAVTDADGAVACRDALIRYLAQRGKQLLVMVLWTRGDAEQLARELLELNPSPDTGAIWIETVVSEFAPDYQGWREGWRIGVSLLNQHRNILRRRFNVPVIFVGATWLPEVIRDNAPDLWSVRTLNVRIEARPEIGTNSITEDTLLNEGDIPETVARESAPDPELALQEAGKLRGTPGAEIQLMDFLRRAAIGLASRRRFAEGESVLRELMEVGERIGISPAVSARILGGLGSVLLRLGRHAEAERFLREAVALGTQELGEENPEVIRNLQQLSGVMVERGDLSNAELIARKLLDLRIGTLGPDNPVTLRCLNNLANVLSRKGDYNEAERLHRDALQRGERVLGPEHPDVLSTVNNLAVALRDKGDLAAAEALYRRAIASRERILGPEHPDTARSLCNLANLLTLKRDFQAAEPLYERALSIVEGFFGAEHPETLQVLNNMSNLPVAKGEFAAAEQLKRRLLSVQERVLGPEHVQTLTNLNNLGNLLASKGDLAAATPILQRALASAERTLVPNHPLTNNLRDKVRQVLRVGTMYHERVSPVAALNDETPKN